ncbi:ROK family protein [Paenibacillus crassostreae]|uniref:Glucokinase n=1 Tax=Paenibacillus crassostreae TaxID=1763538 RepID=A0A167FBU9_9BACL|nr:ROK family protein [Paenibacillus crassostreae]AOZ90843.1 glucokinase [Paenibacillus crassostreae]OAB76391.1 glucokinase [Paenibacillus crassostreae]
MDRNQFIVGIDLGGTNIKAAIFNNEFKTITEKSISTEAALGPNHVLNRIIVTIKEMLETTNLSVNDIKCMGMGTPGLLDPDDGLSIFSPNFPNWENIHVVNYMKTYFDFPTFIDNDVRVNLYGEWSFGAGVGYQNLVLITLGTGLGSGIINDGKVIYGKTSSAGEIGHMNMYREGRPCKCGSSGCLGRYVSAIGMVNTFIEKLNNGQRSIIQDWVDQDQSKISAKMISEAYDLGDHLAIEVLHETGKILGFGLSNVINLLNPEIIIVGGGMSAAGDRLLNIVRETTAKHSLKLSNQACIIQQAQLGEKAGMIGAATYANVRFTSMWRK